MVMAILPALYWQCLCSQFQIKMPTTTNPIFGYHLAYWSKINNRDLRKRIKTIKPSRSFIWLGCWRVGGISDGGQMVSGWHGCLMTERSRVQFQLLLRKIEKISQPQQTKKGLKFNMKLKGKNSLEIGHFCYVAAFRLSCNSGGRRQQRTLTGA